MKARVVVHYRAWNTSCKGTWCGIAFGALLAISTWTDNRRRVTCKNCLRAVRAQRRRRAAAGGRS